MTLTLTLICCIEIDFYSTCIVLGIIRYYKLPRGGLGQTRSYVNTMPFYVRNLSLQGFGHCRGSWSLSAVTWRGHCDCQGSTTTAATGGCLHTCSGRSSQLLLINSSLCFRHNAQGHDLHRNRILKWHCEVPLACSHGHICPCSSEPRPPPQHGTPTCFTPRQERGPAGSAGRAPGGEGLEGGQGEVEGMQSAPWGRGVLPSGQKVSRTAFHCLEISRNLS